MNYASSQVTKFQYARFIAAILSHVLISQNDGVGLVSFDKDMRHYLPPASTSSQLRQILEHLAELEPAAETSLGGILKDVAARLKRRGLVILISDLFDQAEAIRGALTHFAKRKHEVIVFRVLDEAERTFPLKKFAKFVDLETGAHLFVDPARIRKEYLRRFHELDRTIRETCHSMAIDYVPVYTNQPPEYALAKYLTFRATKRKA
jgi:uncharacterized protein (DUF58 family)